MRCSTGSHGAGAHGILKVRKGRRYGTVSRSVSVSEHMTQILLRNASGRLGRFVGDFMAQVSPGSRFAPWWLALTSYLAVCTVTRIVLIVSSYSQIQGNLPGAAVALFVGILFDLIAAAWLCLPLLLFLTLFPSRWLKKRFMLWVSGAIWFAFIFGILFLGAVEYFFFDEFSSRFNSVAVDYLIFPHEVFVNVWDTYPVWQILAVTFIVTGTLMFFLRSRWSAGFAVPPPRRTRLTFAGSVIVLMLLATWTVGPKQASISQNRVVDQLALNGIYAFTEAALTNELDYDVYYARIDSLTAFDRLRTLLAEPGVSFLQPPESLSIDRRITHPGPPRRLNIIVVLEESFGANFVRSLDSAGPGCTPEFEKAANKGLLFTNIYATGNRTVRGMEGLLLSFPPIPGQSIVRRPGGQHVYSMPALLEQEGYQTAFIYGGFSYFDNMGAFAETNGFQRVFDRTDFTKKTFTTIWGVCDEDLFDNSLDILDSIQQAGKPFFSLILTVSNHSPYTYPEGRIAADPKEQRRENAVQYMDYSLGKFLRDAESHPFFDSTIFVVLGDHGARVYGSQTIPMRSYRIPVLMYAPKLLATGQRNPILGSQIDVAPTLMGMLNLSYNSQFFGRDLLRLPPDSGVALMSHNRDVALLRGSHMGVLGLQQEEQLWERKGGVGDITQAPVAEDTAILGDAIAYYQSAYYLYKNHRLHPLAQTERFGPAVVTAIQQTSRISLQSAK